MPPASRRGKRRSIGRSSPTPAASRGGSRRAERRTRAGGLRRAERGTSIAVPRTLLRRMAALALLAAAVLLFVYAREVRLGEAWLQTELLHLGGIDAERIGTAVLVQIEGRLAGINLTTGCSIGPLLGVFLAATSPFVWYRALSLTRLIGAVTQLAALLVLANQIRIAAIVLSMRHWGFERGYDFSHVFLGSAITTVGFVGGLVLFVRLVASKPKATGA